MRRVRVHRAIALAAVVLVGLVGCVSGSSDNVSGDGKLAASARVLVADLAGGRFADVSADFDPAMKEQLSTFSLGDNWRRYQEIVGAYQTIGGVETVKRGELSVERVMIKTANGTGEVRVTYHPDGTIAGLYFLKSGAPAP